MTIRHLRIFIAVAETGSMSAAAQKLYLAQPTVSQAIHELETHYNVLLFERLSRKLYITEDGMRLLALASQTVRQFDTIERNMTHKDATSSLRIGSSITVGTCLIPSVIRELEEMTPGLETFSLVSNTREIEEKLLKSQLDVAVVEGTINSPDLVCKPIIHDQLVLACGRSHEFYSLERVASRQLARQQFAMREEGSGTRRLFEQYLRTRSIHIRVCWEANCPRTILNAILHNNMLSVMSLRLMRHEILHDNVKIFSNQSTDWDRDFKLVYHKNKFMTPEIYALESVLEKYRQPDFPVNNAMGILYDE